MTEPAPTCPNREYCDQHNTNTRQLNIQSGMWKVVLVVAALFISLSVTFGTWQYRQTRAIEEIANRLDKTVGSFIEATGEYRNWMREKLAGHEAKLDDYEDRLRDLEKGER